MEEEDTKLEQEFQIFILKIQCKEQKDLDIACACFESMITNFDFGSFFLEKCYSNEYNEYKNAILCLKAWLFNFWINELSDENKQKILEALFQLIDIKKNISSYIFDIFIFITKNDKEISNIFQYFVPAFLENFNIKEHLIFENFLYFLKKLFSIPETKEFYYPIFKQYIYPIFSEFSLLENDEEKYTKIFNYSLHCFDKLCEIQIDLDDLIQPIEFCKFVISNCNNTRLVSRCSLFLNKCYLNGDFREFLKSNVSEILDLQINNITRFIQKEDDYVVYTSLRTIHLFGITPECYEIVLKSASLTKENLQDFYTNPFYFYSIVYSDSSKLGPRGFSILAFDTLLQTYPDMIQNLKQLEINELSMRIFGFLSNSKISRNDEFIEIRQSFIESILPIKFDNFIDLSSKMFLILRSMKAGLVVDNSYLIDLFVEYFDIPNDVIHSLLCKIVCQMNSFIQEIPNKILLFLPSCQNLSALKAINHISKTQPEILIEIADSLISFNKASIVQEFNSLKEDDNKEEIDIGKINCNLEMLSIFHELLIQIVPLDEIIWIIENILKYDFNEDTLYNSIIIFVNNIFQECSKNENKEDYFLISKQIMICILNNFENSENKGIFIEIYGQIILFPISNNKTMFLSLEISSTLIEFCIEILNFDESPILIACDIISFIIQVDKSIDCDPLTCLCLDYFNQDEIDGNPLFLLGFSNILASIIVTGHNHDKTPVDIFLALIEKNFYVRIYDKYLTAAALISMKDEKLKIEAEKLTDQAKNQKEMSTKDLWRYIDTLKLPISIVESCIDYPFPAPIQL